MAKETESRNAPVSAHQKSSQVREAHYILSTHWDREFYQDFEGFRHRLIKIIDDIINGWETGELEGPLQLDGQVVPIEDYLEVRQSKREQIGKLIRDGHIILGPWYTMPDSFIVSGESLVRNLEMGIQQTRQLGAEPSRAVNCCDIFGFCSQLPQILNGFGIDFAFIWRGTNNHEHRNIKWLGADQTELLCYRFGINSYWGYGVHVRHANDHDHSHNESSFAKDLEHFLNHEADRSATDPILLFDGIDHSAWDAKNYNFLKPHFSKNLGAYTIKHSTLDDYANSVREQAHRITIELQNELREPTRKGLKENGQAVLSGVMSNRVWIKQQNRECESLLCQQTEPLTTATSAILGTEYPGEHLGLAWKHLLQNHFHDTIYGSVTDDAQEDIKYRFSHAKKIAEELSNHAMAEIGANIIGECGDNEVRMLTFNPSFQAIQKIVDCEVWVPENWVTPCTNPQQDWTLKDFNENTYDFQLLEHPIPDKRYWTFPDKEPLHRKGYKLRIAFEVDLPALGYYCLKLTKDGGKEFHQKAFDNDSVSVSDRSLENSLLKIKINDDGSCELKDKVRDQTYKDLLVFEDSGDAGNHFYYIEPKHQKYVHSKGSKTETKVLHHGPMLGTILIKSVMIVPTSLNTDKSARSEEKTELVIESKMTLRKGSDQLEVETNVINNAENHRLRVLLTTSANSPTYLTDTPFDQIERDVMMRHDSGDIGEPWPGTQPQLSWTAIRGNTRGLALFADGLTESMVCDTDEQPIALTLFRSISDFKFVNRNQKAQLLGSLNFRYWIKPINQDTDLSQLHQIGQQITAGIPTKTITSSDQIRYSTKSNLPPFQQWCEVSKEIVVSSFRTIDGDIEIRAFNPASESKEMRIDLSGWPNVQSEEAKWRITNMEGIDISKENSLRDGIISSQVGPKKVVTLRITV
ncbi:glycoside hydrolase family 38 C-terminal domain-containing protein [Rubellicoccus peritrichatus]|uniref:Glycoside hydrolase family 38 C-terminal domain-containing protein n=1 Tax=Rubellicoccus peritrichatus TaxID=3080537 RepID=A0AAQ3LGH4_9BACT|nr:glycoside hydrolase family 38 C-terminal domain-containing protein [Puniceicoccus sp. CR14]WOO43435.1 glycoside hydrolase family 38 C-terminal domain-containing protein [Puniceicoccus sp. CR14]